MEEIIKIIKGRLKEQEEIVLENGDYVQDAMDYFNKEKITDEDMIKMIEDYNVESNEARIGFEHGYRFAFKEVLELLNDQAK